MVVLGAGGLWGRACCDAALRAGHTVLALRREDVDITDHELLGACLREIAPDWVFNAAAWARMERCRDEPRASYQTNVEAVLELGRLAEEVPFQLCHASSDYVFAGERTEPYGEMDQEEPLSEYGRQKKMADNGLLALASGRILITRIAWLFGRNGATFMSQMPGLLSERERLEVAEGRVGSCLYATEGAEIAMDLMAREVAGLVNVVHRGAVTWLEFAQACSEEMEALGWSVRCREIVPVPSSEVRGLAEPRPRFSVLSVERLERLTGRRMTEWREGLRRFLRELGSRPQVSGQV